MSAKTPKPDKSTTKDVSFTRVSPVRPMTESRLAECRQPDRNLFETAKDDQSVVFAVASQHGPEQDFEAEHESAGHRVLYLTRDGERVVEAWVPARHDDLSPVKRAMIVPTDELEPADEVAKRFAPICRRHPEV